MIAELRQKGFVVDKLRRVPCAIAPYRIYADGRLIAGYRERFCAVEALEYLREFWAAVRPGMKLELVKT